MSDNSPESAPEDAPDGVPEGAPEGEQKANPGISRTIIILIIAIIALIIFGVTAVLIAMLRDDEPQPTPTSETLPGTAWPEGEGDPVWDKILASGTMIAGTSADYPPFEYYNNDLQLDGFDIALIRAIGQKLGLAVDIKDLAFDGLGQALQVNQIDVAISAITVTDEREQFIDFTNIYFISGDAQLAAPGSQIIITGADDLVSYRVGVQSGTVYENFVRTDLIETGKMPPANLYVYPDWDHALAELAAGQIDVVLMDREPANAAATEQGFAIVGGGHIRLQIAMAIPQDTYALQASLNAALAELQAEGVVAQLIETYFGFEADLLPPIPTRDPALPTPTPAPPQGCINAMAYVADLTHDDQNFTNIPVLAAGSTFQKGWRVRNVGTCTWDSSYTLVPIGGNQPAALMGGQPTPVQGTVAPGQNYDFYVNLTAPLSPGTYVEYWTMRNPQGTLFGARMWVAITVPSAATATPVATQTPSPSASFTANPETINQGQCSTLSWSSENVQAVYVYPQGANWQDYGVPGSGSRTVCPATTTTYEMRVVKSDGAVEIRTVTVYVIPNTAAPQIDRFTVEPPGTITLGQCLLITWSVSGDVSAINIWRNDTVIRANAPFSGQMQDCPPSTGQFVYKLDASGPGGNSASSATIMVVDQAAPTATTAPDQPTNTPAPTATPTTAPTNTPLPTAAPATAPATVPPITDPIIYTFTATPAEVAVGQCVTVNWSVGGSTTLVQILKNGVVVLDAAPFSGSEQDCELNEAGTVTYELLATDEDGGSASQPAAVTVVGAAPSS